MHLLFLPGTRSNNGYDLAYKIFVGNSNIGGLYLPIERLILFLTDQDKGMQLFH
ncbi:hypothetical protein GGR10_000759 [Bartonella chomelii]|uniref:Uncharacterized protein n=1 Tax=Bartonella chomelii TaxID=236402 RepID=A0ABR6E304_9HYPH|nr:hypothetical protein [Bartonella chomelii]